MGDFNEPWDIPVGLSMALAENRDAFKSFSLLSPAEQDNIIARASTVQSRGEMRSIIKELESRGSR